MRVCGQPGCPELIPTPGRCTKHARAADRARGTRQARGYNAAHDRLRAEWAPKVATGNVRCARCRRFIPADTPWDLGHDDNDRTKHTGPECVACNRATAGRRQM